MPYFFNNGHRLHYQVQGEGPVLLILPGNTATSACHQGELSHFGQRFRAVSLDFWGTGQSDRLEVWPLDWWEQASHDAAALIRELGEESAFVMGTSGGGIVALLMAILHPDQVQAVVADSCVERFPPGILQAEVVERAQHTPGQVSFWTYAQGEDWEPVVAADSAFLLKLEAAGGEPFAGRLKEIRCPVLLTASLADRGMPDCGLQICAMVEQIPGSRAFLLGEGDHPLMWSQADEFRAISDHFLGKVRERLESQASQASAN